LYEPQSGTISVDGLDTTSFDLTELRGQISVVFQDFARYHVSARENIWFGNIEKPHDDGAVYHAAKLAGVDEMITKLPQGYDTIVGHWFEHSEELSVGEWQKLAIARSFMRESQIVVLDEPSSALDPMAEREVFERLNRLARGRTAILISHRLSTVKMADRICVLDEGVIAESGTHAELMARGAIYARLFEKQALDFD
jgi:ATP-binding cassette subfamily B protein